jgi:hypothetical protein
VIRGEAGARRDGNRLATVEVVPDIPPDTIPAEEIVLQMFRGTGRPYS